ncbi:hypothetical protein [Deinococcus radiotolerans]|uniref:Uncharacterized protein n=1 Tax=Deinococcus radiotolerans TaxID=1309407 RepID=A0ABQ2FML7_9DEIO|nr:hypothetical protein [Deinococcus radiotolerans]GGL09302.1 hypothetical protein GCM10010844_30010 [Deinococcus radiotolerans]
MSERRTRTLNTLIRLGRALADPAPDPVADATQVARRTVSALREPVEEAGAGLRARARDLRDRASQRADDRLERLITERRGGAPSDPEVLALLTRRREAREARLSQEEARRTLLARAQTPTQRQVLRAVLDVTPWAGGSAGTLRYTQMLDRLAPGGDAATEMSVHRAIWTLAEAGVLAVSPHGEVSAVPPRAPLALPSTEPG